MTAANPKDETAQLIQLSLWNLFMMVGEGMREL